MVQTDCIEKGGSYQPAQTLSSNSNYMKKRGPDRVLNPVLIENGHFPGGICVQTPSHTRKEDAERRIKRDWYPTVLLAIALNLCLLCSCFYIIYRADNYSTDKTDYLISVCMIIFIPLLPAVLLLFTPWPESWRRRRDRFSERDPSTRWKNIVNITAALASFVITLSYLLLSAVPKYNSPIWATNMEFLNEVPVPAVSFIFQHTAIDGMELPVSYAKVNDSHVGESIVFSGFDSTVNDSTGGLYKESVVFSTANFTALIANTSDIRSSVDSPLGNAIGVTIGTTFNSTAANNLPTYSSQILLAIFDSRMSISDVIECGLVQVLAVSAFSDISVIISMSQIVDKHEIVRPSSNYPSFCNDGYKSLMANENPPFTVFDTTITQMTNTVEDYSTDCDIAVDPEAICRSSVTLVYGSQFVNNQKSVPGKSQQDIWIDCGAIVGAVQFFAWFALVFFHA